MNENTVNHTQDKTNFNIEELLIKEALKNIDNPFKNLTVRDIAKDLKMGENLANQVFKRKDFPSVNIGKTKTIMKLAYIIWKMKRRENEVNINEENE